MVHFSLSWCWSSASPKNIVQAILSALASSSEWIHCHETHFRLPLTRLENYYVCLFICESWAQKCQLVTSCPVWQHNSVQNLNQKQWCLHPALFDWKRTVVNNIGSIQVSLSRDCAIVSQHAQNTRNQKLKQQNGTQPTVILFTPVHVLLWRVKMPLVKRPLWKSV